MTCRPIKSSMSIYGHPIHPMMIHFPVAALSGLNITDIGFIFTDDFFWARAGFWLAIVGTLGGVVSSVVGMADLLSVSQSRKMITACCHALFAVMMLSVASLNLLLRIPNPEIYIPTAGIYLSLLTSFLIMLTSILGGHLVYEYGVGVDLKVKS